MIAPSIGYFLVDKFAVGIRPSFNYSQNNLIAGGKDQTVLAVGPFIRYYFLPSGRPFNILAETAYAYYIFNNASTFKQHGLFVAAGPVIYFNTSVGLEFLFGYSSTKVVGYDGRNTALRFGIGFQFHLERL